MFIGEYSHNLDNKGRIIIPSKFREELHSSFILTRGPLGIKKECVIVGANDHIEIWNKETWDEYLLEANANFEEVAENLSDLLEDE